MDFNLIFPRKIIFEKNSILKIGNIIKKFNKPLVISGSKSLKNNGFYEKIIKSLFDEKIDFAEYSEVNCEPDSFLIDEVVEYAKKNKAQSLIAIGGGSVIDMAKAAAGLINNQPGIENYLEGVGKGFKLINDPVPFIAIPTTAGSGAEATYNSVISSKEKKYKKSFRDERLMAELIIADPVLTLSLSEKQTVFSGMDAICQLIESFTSKKRKPYTSALCSFYIKKAIDSLKKIKINPGSINDRSTMLEASLASGIALANSGLGAVHGFASGMGGLYDIPHGLICAVLLPGICKINCAKDDSSYKELASIMGIKNNDVRGLINYLYQLNEELGIPKDFKSFNIKKDQALLISNKSQGSSMSCNPVDFSIEEYRDFIEEYL